MNAKWTENEIERTGTIILIVGANCIIVPDDGGECITKHGDEIEII